MITLTIMATLFAIVGGIILALGAGFIVIFGDFLVAMAVIIGICRLIDWIKHRKRKEELK